ncbi:MAG: tRNA (guanosine(46)-N7)-methyltransferase TrmB [Parafilimonas sp.]
MGQKKLMRFEEIKTFPNVLEYPGNMPGQWKKFFKNDNPVTLELACGKGEYVLGLGRMYANRNFIGIDIKGNRLWKGAKAALQQGFSNVAFLRIQIDKITDYFSKDEVTEIWLTFPDPQLRLSKAKKRLTHPNFLRLYKTIVKKDGAIHLKTDSPELYQFTKTVINLYGLELLCDYDDVYSTDNINDELRIRTHYETLDIAKSKRVHYLQFKINNELPVEKDETLKAILREQQIN